MAVSTYPVTWTDQAKKDKNNIERYLTKNWSEQQHRIFFNRLDQRISLIARNPKMAPVTREHKNVRRSVLNKQVTMYYRFDGHQVEILFLFDNRQDPKKKNL